MKRYCGLKHLLYIHPYSTIHPFIHSFVQTCKEKVRKTISSSGSTHGVGLNQQTRSLLHEIRVQKQSSPFSETPNPSTHTHMHTSVFKTPTWHTCSLETLHLLHFQQLITHMGLGGGEVSWGWRWGNSELWPFGQSTLTELANVCVHVCVDLP